MQRHLIAGEETGKPGKPLAVHDPAIGEVVEEASSGNAEDVEAAYLSPDPAAVGFEK